MESLLKFEIKKIINYDQLNLISLFTSYYGKLHTA